MTTFEQTDTHQQSNISSSAQDITINRTLLQPCLTQSHHSSNLTNLTTATMKFAAALVLAVGAYRVNAVVSHIH